MADSSGVSHLRVALTTREYASLVDFFCAGLGLQAAASWTHEDGRGMLLEMGAGSLEVFDEAYAQFVDGVEVGHTVGGAVR